MVKLPQLLGAEGSGENARPGGRLSLCSTFHLCQMLPSAESREEGPDWLLRSSERYPNYFYLQSR